MSTRTFLLPDLGEGLADAEVVRWLVAEGDVVEVDQLVVEVETAKSLVDVPTPFAGRVAQLHAVEGGTVDVGSPLISVDPVDGGTGAAPGTASPDDGAGEAYRDEERAGSGNVLIGYGTSHSGPVGRRRRPRADGRPGPTPGPTPVAAPLRAGAAPRVVSPLVRRLARDLGVDLVALSEQLDGAVVGRTAVLEAAAAVRAARPDAASTPPRTGDPEAPGERRIPMSGFRRAVSAALVRSRTEIPEATVWVDVDATGLVAVRAAAKAAGRPVPGLLAYLGRFVVAGLKAYPVLNSRVDAEAQEIVELDRVDLGIAVQSPRGLVVPAVRDAGTMTTTALHAAVVELVGRAREGRATAEELAAGTFTLNNYGGFRVDGSAPIINHPQVAMLGFGRILERPWVVGGQIVVRQIVQMSLAFDHRVCDGGTAAGFMRVVADAVEDPVSAIAHL